MSINNIDIREFEIPDGEIYMDFYQADSKYFKDIKSFFDEIENIFCYPEGGEPLFPKKDVYFSQLKYKERVSPYLIKFCNIDLVGTEKVYTICDLWNENDYIFSYKHYYCRFEWFTSA